MSLLTISDLRIDFDTGSAKPVHAVRSVNLEIAEGVIVGLIGDSGCGKSSLARAIAGAALPHGSCLGSIRFRGIERNEDAGRRRFTVNSPGISLIPQHPSLSLNPFLKVSDQVIELLRAHRTCEPRLYVERMKALLDSVKLHDVVRIASSYPHQLSGGEKQRVVIAQALACAPNILISDESTASVDAPMEADLMALFASLRNDFGVAILWITHNPAHLRGFADRTIVMYAGRFVETGPTEAMLDRPLHPYTRALMKCSPANRDLAVPARGEHLPSIPGMAPDPSEVSAGCSFAPRCADRTELCDREAPCSVACGDHQMVECNLYGN